MKKKYIYIFSKVSSGWVGPSVFKLDRSRALGYCKILTKEKK